MSALTEIEQRVEQQAAELVERAAAGTVSGTYAATHLGPRFASSVGSFVASSAKAERAFLRFKRASLACEARRDVHTLAALDDSAREVEALASKAGLTSQERDALRAEVTRHRLAAQRRVEAAKEVTEKIAATIPRGVGARSIRADILAARVRNAFVDATQELAQSGKKLTAAEIDFLVAHRKFAEAVGAELDDGWLRGLDYLIDNPAEVKAWRDEMKRLRGVLAKETDPETIEQLGRAIEATRKRGVHSKLKGLLGEVFAVRSEDWKLIRSGYEDLAKRAATKLGGEWKAVTVSGNMFLGGKETWDEAILLVRAGSNPPEAKLFLAAQFKVALEPTALTQTLNDTVREAAKSDLRIVLQDGREEWYLLSPMPPGELSHRWVLNAAGGEYAPAEVAALLSRGVKVSQTTLPMSVNEFNLLADRLLEACASIFD